MLLSCLPLAKLLLYKKHLEFEWFIQAVSKCASMLVPYMYARWQIDTLTYIIRYRRRKVKNITNGDLTRDNLVHSRILYISLSLCCYFQLNGRAIESMRNLHPFDSAKSAGRSNEHSTVEYVSQTVIDDASHRRKLLLVKRVEKKMTPSILFVWNDIAWSQRPLRSFIQHFNVPCLIHQKNWLAKLNRAETAAHIHTLL